MINKLFKDSTDNIFIQLFRYIFVGGTAFVVDFFFLYFFSDICGIYYLISAVLSFIISVIVNYIMSTKWVFNQYNIENKVLEFNLFILISSVGLVFTEILLYFFTDICGFYYLISKIIAAIIILFWNFLARRVMFYGKDFI
ncbi:MAG: GtrA family protein [Methanobrevibacter ruminantium]|uniref:GtrA family protein n=1 Tax=Methanobrevibacter ruminantium TaxID=83816 RepID=UPI002D7FE7A5|nr:GtrA family protein [Methanobrevibacter ruminantium]MCI5737762.1 GtrA family protein [Methanobrevibacter ruminantium]